MRVYTIEMTHNKFGGNTLFKIQYADEDQALELYLKLVDYFKVAGMMHGILTVLLKEDDLVKRVTQLF